MSGAANPQPVDSPVGKLGVRVPAGKHGRDRLAVVDYGRGRGQTYLAIAGFWHAGSHD